MYMTMTQARTAASLRTDPAAPDSSFDWDFDDGATATVSTPAATTSRRPTAQPVHRTYPANAALRAIAASIRADVPVMIWGEPGTGKTASLTCMLEAWGYYTQVIIGSIRDTTDMLGLPVELNGEVIYSPPAWAKRANAAAKAALLWDEFTTNGSIMAAMLRVIQEKEAGDLKLADTVRMVGIANPPECSANGVDLPAPMANRFVHIDWQFDIDGWLEGLSTNFVNAPTYSMDTLTVEATAKHKLWVTALVMGYLAKNTAVIEPGVPKSPVEQARAWASPRSWTNLMNVLFHLDPADTTAISKAAAGAVGAGQGLTFMAYVEGVGLFDPEEVLDGKVKVDWKDSSRIDRLFALTMAVKTIAISRGDISNWVKAMEVLTECARQGRHDTPVIALKDLLKHRPQGAKITSEQRTLFSRWITI